jgi:hypothetical protein
VCMLVVSRCEELLVKVAATSRIYGRAVLKMAVCDGCAVDVA